MKKCVLFYRTFSSNTQRSVNFFNKTTFVEKISTFYFNRRFLLRLFNNTHINYSKYNIFYTV